MKNYCAALAIIGLFISFTASAQNNNVGIGTTSPDASAVLEMVSTSQGVLVPRMLESERLLIKSAGGNPPATGLLVYQTDGTSGFYFYDGAAWVSLNNTAETDPEVESATTNAVPKWDGSKLVDGSITDDGTNVGIGTTSPNHQLEIKGSGMGFSHTSPNGLSRIGTYANDGYLYIQTHTNHNLYFATNNANAQMTLSTNGNLGIGTTIPDASAKLEVSSTTQGFLPPRMTIGDMQSIPSPAEGLVVYNTDHKTLNVFDGVFWVDMNGVLVGTVQQRLDNGETPKQIYDSGMPLDSLYGKTYKEGLIAYLNTSTGTGFVAAPADIVGLKTWGCWGTSFYSAVGEAIGTGYQNTLDIIANICQQTDGIQSAAEACAAIPVNGGTPWYLPSKDELYQMYKNLHRYGCAATAAGATGGYITAPCATSLGGFGSGYWSSTEFGSYNAWSQNFTNGYQNFFNIASEKHIANLVRAVRAF